MHTYPKAKVNRMSGKRNLHAVITIPMDLREFANNQKQRKLSLGTRDPVAAKIKLPYVQAKFYEMFDWWTYQKKGLDNIRTEYLYNNKSKIELVNMIVDLERQLRGKEL